MLGFGCLRSLLDGIPTAIGNTKLACRCVLVTQCSNSLSFDAAMMASVRFQQLRTF